MRYRLRRSSIVLAVLGIVLIASAAVTRFAAAPALTKLPGDTDTTAHYAGTATVLNSKALAANDTAHALAKDVPITIDRHVRVTGTSGDIATTNYDVTLNVPGAPAAPDRHTFAIDRTTMQATEQPGNTGIESTSGIVFTLPLHPDAADYTIYDTTTRKTFPLTYTGTGTVSGRDTYNYGVNATGPVENPNTLATLPKALPKSLVTQVLPLLNGPDQQAVTAALPGLPDMVPLVYTATTKAQLLADKTLGVPLNSNLSEQILATIDIGDRHVSLLPVLDINAALTDASVADLVDTATSHARTLSMLELWIPLALLIIGIALVVSGVLRMRNGGNSTNVAAPVTAEPRVGADD
ncbi:porin PorA family protein [Nocardia spumae]|uniref:porin PorA family protein n=1 Tax=Nocardia spumae TaxID=2887190 RepID=UPI001D1447C4|nr:porin PorA family protein [Nocardia spumae]